MIKLKWKVSEKPTGRYRSFSRRSWPDAWYENGDIAASIICESEYVLANVKIGNHKALRIRIADHAMKPWLWRTLMQRAHTLKEAKELVKEFLNEHPSYTPMEIHEKAVKE